MGIERKRRSISKFTLKKDRTIDGHKMDIATDVVLISMNITEKFPTEIVELIFHHLPTRDIISCTRVNPIWNEIIESSKSCMNKLTLKIDHLKFSKIIDFVPKRKYENLKLELDVFNNVGKIIFFDDGNFTQYEERILQAINLGCQWKKVSIIGLASYGFSPSFFERLFKFIEPTVTSILLDLITAGPCIKIQHFKFPHLKILCSARSDNIFDTPLEPFSCTSLEKFLCDNVSISSYSIIRLIQSQKNLKEIIITGHKIPKVCKDQINTVESVEILGLVFLSKFVESDFENFIKLFPNLNELRIDILTANIVEMLAANCRKLGKIILDSSHGEPTIPNLESILPKSKLCLENNIMFMLDVFEY